MAKTLGDIYQKIQDEVANSTYVNTYKSRIFRAINDALNDLNAGDPEREEPVVYDFQLEEQNVPFNHEVTGSKTGSSSTTVLTDTTAGFVADGVAIGDMITNDTDGSTARVVSVDSATQITCTALADGTDNTWTSGDEYTITGTNYEIASSWNFRAPYSLRLSEDEDVEFEYVEDKDFTKHKFVSPRGQPLYGLTYKNGTRLLRIDWDTNERFIFEFYTENMVESSAGTRAAQFENELNTSDFLLVPDKHWMAVVNLACSHVVEGMMTTSTRKDTRVATFYKSGIQAMRRLMQEHGRPLPRPRQQLKVMNEWPRRVFGKRFSSRW